MVKDFAEREAFPRGAMSGGGNEHASADGHAEFQYLLRTKEWPSFDENGAEPEPTMRRFQIYNDDGVREMSLDIEFSKDPPHYSLSGGAGSRVLDRKLIAMKSHHQS